MKKLCLILLMHLFLYAYPQVEICNLNQIYTTTDTLYPFRYSDYCSAVYVDGSCKVLSEDGFVRIILIDNNEEEWLIYERNNLFSTEICDKFTNASFETFMMDNVVPTPLL